MGEREADEEDDWGDWWTSAAYHRDRSRGRDWWSQGSDAGSAARPASSAAPCISATAGRLGSEAAWAEAAASSSSSAIPPPRRVAPRVSWAVDDDPFGTGRRPASRVSGAVVDDTFGTGRRRASSGSPATVPVDERPRRHARAGHSNRPSRQERNALFWFWSAIRATRPVFMGISDFRREVERWLNTTLYSAQQDVSSASASRRPIDADPVGAIDGRVVDAVEESLAETVSGFSQNRPTFDIQHQAPLGDSELLAMYGIGFRLLQSRIDGSIDGSTPLAHVRRPGVLQRAVTSVHASTARPGTVGVATVAEEVIDLVAESPTCRICMCPANAEDGPLRAYGVACSHVFHLHCITQWSLFNRTDCPVCRQCISLRSWQPSQLGNS